MVEYILTYNDGDQDIEYVLYLVQSLDYSAPQAIIKKESVGSDGGLVVNTGRLLKTIAISGKLIHKKIQYGTRVLIMKDYNEIKDEIEDIKESGYVLTLRSPMSTSDAGKYIIENFSCALLTGVGSYLSFTLKLVEYRQANTKISLVNLVAVGPRDEFLSRYINVSLQGA